MGQSGCFAFQISQIGWALCEEANFGTLKLIRRTNLQLSTEPAFLPNASYVLSFCPSPYLPPRSFNFFISVITPTSQFFCVNVIGEANPFVCVIHWVIRKSGYSIVYEF